MREKTIAMIVCVLFLTGMLILLATIGENIEAENSSEPTTKILAPHAPIRIDSDTDFPAIATFGNGNPGNPWIIENWDIDGTGEGYCIFVGNTTDYFEIRNCLLSNANGNDDWLFENSGIHLFNVQNGAIINNTASSNDEYGIFLEERCDENILANNTVSSNNNNGIYLSWSDSNTISNNTVSSNYNWDIYIDCSKSNTLTSNVMTGDGLSLGGWNDEHWNTHSIDTSNIVNGNSIYYWKKEVH